MGTARFCTSRISFFKKVYPPWTSLPFRNTSQKFFNESPQYAGLPSKVTAPLTPSLLLQELETLISQSLCPRQPPILTSPTSASLLANGRQGTFPSWLTCQLCQNVLFQTLWELFPLDYFLSTALYFQETSGELKFLRRTRASDSKISHSCSENILSASASWLDVRDSQPGYLHC